MENRGNNLQSEFEQKLRESELRRNSEAAPVTDTTTTASSEADTTAPINNTTASTTQATAASVANQEKYIPVVEEQIRIDKKTVETGSVHVYKDVHEEQVSVDVPYVQEEVNIERVPVNQFVDAAPPSVRYEGDVMIIPVLHEELVLVKRLKLVEEIRVTKRKVETHEQQRVTLRKEEVNVNRVNLNGDNTTRI